MYAEISVGEAIDKLSILEIKYERIADENKKIEIKKEIDALQECNVYKHTHTFYYNLLMYVNTKIWDMTDTLQQMISTDNNYAAISHELFVFNQKRYRLKRVFNMLSCSNIKEQKNNRAKCCKVVVNDEAAFYKHVDEINYLILDYDFIYFESPFISSIQAVFNIPVFNYNNKDFDETTCTNIDLLALKSTDIKCPFQFKSSLV